MPDQRDKDTLAPFRSLGRRLAAVPRSEVEERDRQWRRAKQERRETREARKAEKA